MELASAVKEYKNGNKYGVNFEEAIPYLLKMLLFLD